MPDNALVGRCGMYCGSCPIYRASHDKDEKKTFELSFSTRCTIDMIKCEGCGTSDRFALSKGCIFRKCANGRSLSSCGLCQEFPCDTLPGLYEDDMRSRGDAEKNARRIREAGIEKWLEEAEARWSCGRCRGKIALDMKICPGCEEALHSLPEK